MILDATANLDKYSALCGRFDAVCGFLSRNDIYSLTDGRYEIDGEDIFMTVASGMLRPAAETPLEVHDKYIDIHIPLTGTEIIGWAPRSVCADPKGEFSRENDILFYGDTPVFYAGIPKGMAAVYFPDDAHAPLIGEGGYRKCIFKIKAG